jgi:hypothetical protein
MEDVKPSRKKWLVPVIVLSIILFGFVSYQWVIPRTNLEVRTVYHESPGGGGTGGTINLNILITNWGNRQVSSLDCFVFILDNTGKEVARNRIQDMTLSRGENAEIKLPFVGSQYIDYSIIIDLGFESSGNDYSDDIQYETQEDQMNLVFVKNIR